MSNGNAYPLAKLLPPYIEDEPPDADPKKRYGIGTSTYMKAVSSGHQFCQSTHPCTEQNLRPTEAQNMRCSTTAKPLPMEGYPPVSVEGRPRRRRSPAHPSCRSRCLWILKSVKEKHSAEL